MDDEKAAAMIDIIHDNFDNAFILTYNRPLGGKVLESFSTCAEKKREFSAVFAGAGKAVNKQLKNTISKFERNNKVS